MLILFGMLAGSPASATQLPPDETPPAPVGDLGRPHLNAPTYPRGFFIPAYFEIDDSATNTLNQNFDLVIVGRQSNYSGLSREKTLVVAGPALLYSNSMASPDEWNVIDSHEEWFLHSSPEPSPQTRIPLSDLYPHLFFMNIGAEGWRDFVVSRYSDVATGGPLIDGVFVDEVLGPAGYVSLLGSAYPSYDATSYSALALQLIYAVKDAVNGKLVILNTELSKAFTLAADGGMAEGFVHFGGRRNDEHISKNRWLQNIATINDRDFDGKYLLIGSGSLEVTLPSMLEYCYASYLIGYNRHAHCYFYWHSNAEGGYATINWFPVWEMQIGEPTGDYFESAGLFWRNFTAGLAVANPNDSGDPITVNLGDLYLDSSGNSVSSLTLSNKTGAVLKRVW